VNKKNINFKNPSFIVALIDMGKKKLVREDKLESFDTRILKKCRYNSLFILKTDKIKSKDLVDSEFYIFDPDRIKKYIMVVNQQNKQNKIA
jgi:hypothetical protein